MGGNVVFGDAEATPIDLNKNDRQVVLEEIQLFMDTLRIDESPWASGNAEYYLSGSSAWLADKSITCEDLRLLKGTFSDIDIMFDKLQADKLISLFESEGPHAKNAELIGFKRSANTIVTLWDFECLDGYTQVDFELVDFRYFYASTEGDPTEWAQWAFNSSWDDWRLARCKGVAQKLLFRACGALTWKKMQDTKGEEFWDTQVALSNSGMREKFAYGRNWVVTGKDKDRTFITDRKKIFSRLFPNVQAIDARVDLFFSSYIGMIDGIKFFGNGNLKVVDRFAEILFGKDSQELYRDNPARDYHVKFNMFRELTDRLNTNIAQWAHIIEAYGNFQNDGLLEEAVHRDSL